MTAWLRWAIQRVGYAVRPYDMLADARRWFWQPRQRCGRPRSAAPPYLCDGIAVGDQGQPYAECGHRKSHPAHPLDQAVPNAAPKP